VVVFVAMISCLVFGEMDLGGVTYAGPGLERWARGEFYLSVLRWWKEVCALASASTVFRAIRQCHAGKSQ
jgi:hypothetical protein